MAKVYVKTEEINNQNIITEIITDINSDIFQTDLTGWIQIDEGDVFSVILIEKNEIFSIEFLY